MWYLSTWGNAAGDNITISADAYRFGLLLPTIYASPEGFTENLKYGLWRENPAESSYPAVHPSIKERR